MKWIIIILGSLIALGGIFYLIGAFLPVKHVATVHETFNTTAEKLWAVLTNYKDYTSWRRGLKNVNAIDSTKWKESGEHGEVSYELEEVEKNKKLITRITNKDLPYGGYWYFELKEIPQGCSLTITEHGEVYNPVFRFMSKYLFGHSNTIKNYMQDLRDKVDSKN